VHIGSQNAVNINNVEGTLYTGPQSGQFVALADVRRAVGELGDALARTDLPGPVQEEARARVRDLDREMRRPEPDRDRVTEHVSRLTKILYAAGALATAATGLLGPLSTVAGWLGGTIASFL